METLERVIHDHPFFEGLGEPYIELLSGCAANKKFEAGCYIFREGGEANEFYLLRSGKVALEMADHRPIIVATLGEGDVLGWSWLLPPYHWKFQAHVIDTVRAFALDGRCLRKKCEENHDLGYELLKRFAKIIDQRLDATRFQLLDVFGVRTVER
jgi:CRP-like cAMP-binding protein